MTVHETGKSPLPQQGGEILLQAYYDQGITPQPHSDTLPLNADLS